MRNHLGLHASRVLAPALLAALVGACAEEGVIAVVRNDGGIVITGGETCADLQKRTTAWAASHSSCAVDGDCRRAGTTCGLPFNCGTFVNVEGARGLATITTAWNSAMCGATIDCAPCPQPPEGSEVPACNQGVCGVKVRSCDIIQSEVTAYIDSHRACTADSDCAVLVTGCGLPGVCGAAVRADAAPGLSALDNEWGQRQCFFGKACPDCAPRTGSACIQRRCELTR